MHSVLGLVRKQNPVAVITKQVLTENDQMKLYGQHRTIRLKSYSYATSMVGTKKQIKKNNHQNYTAECTSQISPENKFIIKNLFIQINGG